jgi:glyoxylase-like metal-dependent hydrolase (beta-lactamase superfamily II)
MRKTLSLLFISLFLVTFSSPTTHAADDRAREWVRHAADALGGVEALRAIRVVGVEGIGHRFLVEQSERPEGPLLLQYEQMRELRDAANVRLRQEYQQRGVLTADWTPMTLVVDGSVAAMERDGKFAPGSLSQVEDAKIRLALAPERAVLAALDAKDLAAAADAELQGVPHHVVSWRWEGAPARLFLNAATGLPTAVEVVRAFPYSTFWGVWGDVTIRMLFSNWALLPGGIRYPEQFDDERNGTPYRSFVVTKLEINPKVEADAFAIPAETKSAFAARPATTIDEIPLGRPDKKPIDVAEGIVELPGWWNVTLVRQTDGVVVVEAPISSGYSAKVIDEVARRYPNAPIKAVVTTSDAWPHIGGLREYAARGIPVYALDANRPILERLFAARRTTNPDALARAPKRPKLEIVSSKTAIGSGPNRIELYPIRGEGAERMLMVYFPERKLLYGADLLQPMPDGTFFNVQYVAELAEAARRERLAVERTFAMHAEPIAWPKITAAVAAVYEKK